MEIPTPILVEHPEPPDPPSSPKGKVRYVLAGCCALFLLLVGMVIRTGPSTIPSEPSSGSPGLSPVPTAVPLPSGQLYTSPTPQTRWRDIHDPAVYMPTGSGRVASAGFGSVRTSSSGAPRFHEGVDVSPLKRDRKQRALDPILAIADGTVAYISRSAGNSSYGIYLVLAHEDDAGTVFSLYAHLASVAKELKRGTRVSRGDQLGVMGASSTLGIPVARSHLHLELCLKLNGSYSRYSRAKKLSNPHGEFHGFNLVGFDPRVLLFQLHDRDPVPFSYLEALQAEPVAWRLLIRGSRRPEFFDRHPVLWSDTPATGSAFWVEVSHGGVPLAGGYATQKEAGLLQGGRHRVLEADPEVLGRNARRHVIRRNGHWVLGPNGVSWKDILLYRP